MLSSARRPASRGKRRERTLREARRARSGLAPPRAGRTPLGFHPPAISLGLRPNPGPGPGPGPGELYSGGGTEDGCFSGFLMSEPQ